MGRRRCLRVARCSGRCRVGAAYTPALRRAEVRQRTSPMPAKGPRQGSAPRAPLDELCSIRPRPRGIIGPDLGPQSNLGPASRPIAARIAARIAVESRSHRGPAAQARKRPAADLEPAMSARNVGSGMRGRHASPPAGIRRRRGPQCGLWWGRPLEGPQQEQAAAAPPPAGRSPRLQVASPSRRRRRC